MSALLELDLAARLKRAEDRWLAQCNDRLRRAGAPQPDHQESETEEVER